MFYYYYFLKYKEEENFSDKYLNGLLFTITSYSMQRKKFLLQINEQRFQCSFSLNNTKELYSEKVKKKKPALWLLENRKELQISILYS